MATLVKKIYIIIVYFGFLFFGGGFLIVFGQFTLYNGFGNFFEYLPADEFTISKGREDRMPRQFIYQYSVAGRTFDGSQTVSTETFENTDINKIVVFYNRVFNFSSMLEGIEGESELSKSGEQIYGMVIFGFLFQFIFLIYKFADMDKWIGVYTRGEYKSSRKK